MDWVWFFLHKTASLHQHLNYFGAQQDCDLLNVKPMSKEYII